MENFRKRYFIENVQNLKKKYIFEEKFFKIVWRRIL